MEMSLEEHMAHVDKRVLGYQRGVEDLKEHFRTVPEESPKSIYRVLDPEPETPATEES
jgi:hypothetical protein